MQDMQGQITDREMIVNSSKMQEKHQHRDIWSADYGEEIQIRKRGVRVKMETQCH